MAQQNKPLPQNELHGVYLSGSPVARPIGTASRCENLRVMPGYWLRLFGGRKGRLNLSTDTVQQIQPFRYLNLQGTNNTMLQIKKADNSVNWTEYFFTTDTINLTPAVQIATANDSAYCRTHAAASCNLPDTLLLYNGLGTREPTASKPPFSAISFTTGVERYFGLDCYAPSANPTTAMTTGAGNNAVLTSVQVWVGVYDTDTEHYSNAIYCGTLTTNAGGTISVSNLDRIKAGWANTAQRDKLKFCFYATIDGGGIPYLILNSALNAPYSVAITSTSTTLSIAAGTVNGWVLDVAHEAPSNNHPPRPMSSICYANGRIYGVPLGGGAGDPVSQRPIGGETGRPDFSYRYTSSRETSGVYWCAAYGDPTRGDSLGDPLQSWPLTNYAPTPNGDQPLAVFPSQNGISVIVLTPRATYLLTEAADGIHEWDTVSETCGLSRIETLVNTQHGVIWVDQRNQIVLFDGRSIVRLSATYQPLMNVAPVCADWLLDPMNEVDQYRVWLTGGGCVVHDFKVNEVYTATGQAYTAARTVTDSTGKQWHLAANTAIYTQEGQPDTGLVATGIETFTTGQTKATTYPTGVYERNWDELGDTTLRKDLKRFDVLGDGGGAELRWRTDFKEAITANEQVAHRSKASQSVTDCLWLFSLAGGSAFWHTLKLTVTATGTIPASYPTADLQGNQARNFFGCILRLLFTYDSTGSRQ